jgi:hypothetical protein
VISDHRTPAKQVPGMDEPLKVELASVTDVEMYVLVLIIGICDAIAQSRLVAEDAERMIFSPRAMNTLRTLGVRAEIVDLVHAGTELDDIGEIVPDHLPERLAELRERALSVLGTLRKPDTNPWL